MMSQGLTLETAAAGTLSIQMSRPQRRHVMLGMHRIGTLLACGTHIPSVSPTPSGKDRSMTEKYLRAFGSDRDRYLIIIIGNRDEVPAMTVWSAEKCGKWPRWVELHDQSVELP